MCWMTRNGKPIRIDDGFNGSIHDCPHHGERSREFENDPLATPSLLKATHSKRVGKSAIHLLPLKPSSSLPKVSTPKGTWADEMNMGRHFGNSHQETLRPPLEKIDIKTLEQKFYSHTSSDRDHIIKLQSKAENVFTNPDPDMGLTARDALTQVLTPLEAPSTPWNNERLIALNFKDVVERDVREGRINTQKNGSRVKLLIVDNSGMDFPSGRYGRAFGHAAISVDGIVYNKTPEGFSEIPKEKYINTVTKRQVNPQNIVEVEISATDIEAHQLQQAIQKEMRGGYNIVNKNCTTCSLHALKDATQGS